GLREPRGTLRLHAGRDGRRLPDPDRKAEDRALGRFDVACRTERHRHRPRGAVQPATRRVRELPPIAVPASVRRAARRRGRRQPGFITRGRGGRALEPGPDWLGTPWVCWVDV